MKITLEFPSNKQKEFEALLLSWRMDNSQRFEVNGITLNYFLSDIINQVENQLNPKKESK
jgi:hypothetical protein